MKCPSRSLAKFNYLQYPFLSAPGREPGNTGTGGALSTTTLVKMKGLIEACGYLRLVVRGQHAGQWFQEMMRGIRNVPR